MIHALLMHKSPPMEGLCTSSQLAPGTTPGIRHREEKDSLRLYLL